MDHVPLIDQEFRRRFATKLYAGNEYDWKGFWGFPQRLGWNSEYLELGFVNGMALMLLTKPRAHRQPGDTVQDPKCFASLLQSWLYHAMLHEVLGSHFDLDEFYVLAASGDKILSTKSLESLIKVWALKLQTLESPEARKCISCAMKCTSYVNKLMTSLSDRIQKHTKDFFASKSWGKLVPFDADIETENMFYWQRQGRKILPESLEISICVLGYTLEYAGRSIYQKLSLGDTDSIDCPPMPGWYIPRPIQEILVAKGHCLLSISRFSYSLGLIGACLASTVDHTSQKDDHKECSEKRCFADNIKIDEYIRKHSNDGCCCSDILDEKAWSTMLQIIDSDGIPVVRVLQMDGECCPKLAFQVSDSRDVQGYVAFSHVWADGRGNANGNGLLLCHWLELQALAQNYWTATPSVSTDPFERLVPFWFDVFCVPLMRSSAQVQALRRKAISMMTEIYRSAAVVLILDSGLKLLRPTSPREFGIHLSFSKWLRRLWTMHEGAVGKRVEVQTATGPIHLDSQISEIVDLIASDTSPDTEAVIGGIGAVESVNGWAICFSAQFSTGEEAFRFAWDECLRRSTSLDSDRYIVLGMLLNLDKDTLKFIQRSTQDRHDTAEASRAKWRAILQAQKEFPSGIIFNFEQKLSDPGFGWAPDSMEYPINFDGRPAGILTKHGLRVSYKGMRLLSHPNWDIKFTGNPCAPARIKRELGERRAFGVKISGNPTQRYSININRSTWDPTDSSLRPEANLAILLQPMARAKDPGNSALLVELYSPPGVDDEDGHIIFARVQTGLYCIRLPDSDTDTDILSMGLANGTYEIIDASWIGNGTFQEWCVGV